MTLERCGNCRTILEPDLQQMFPSGDSIMLLPTMSPSRKPELDVSTLAARVRDHGREGQLFLNSVLVSVAVANAAYVFALLLASGITPILWLPFMLASFGFVLITFSGSSTTMLLVVSLADLPDSFFPLVHAM